MSYILKNTSGLINTRLTDTARQKMSQGKFNISYFQVGDSEVSYNALPSSYNQMNTNILEPNFNSQNSAGSPQSNKQNIKYPYFVDIDSNNTYGIPFMSSIVSPVYNTAPLIGFFSGNTDLSPISWSALTNNQYAINSNYIVNLSSLVGSNQISLIYNECNSNVVRQPAVGDLITIYYDVNGENNCQCYSVTTTTTTSPCWLSGFTFQFYDLFDNNQNTYYTLQNTNVLINGYPSYIIPMQGITIYFNTDVNRWVFGGLGINSDIFGPSGDTPIGDWFGDDGEGESVFLGSTYCGDENYCVNFCINESECFNLNTIKTEIIDVNDISYEVVLDGFESDIDISYDNETGYWSAVSGSTLIFIQEGTSESLPIGSWSAVSDFDSFTTNLGICELSDFCQCLDFSSITDGSFVEYLDCNYSAQTITLDSGETINNVCVVSNPNFISNIENTLGYYVINGDIEVTLCDNDFCNQLSPASLFSEDPCNPTTTTTTTEYPITTTTTTTCEPPQQPNCTMSMSSCYSILTYRIVDICLDVITLDRKTPDFSYLSSDCFARTIVYPPNMTTIYDSVTPLSHWDIDAINYETVCDIDQFNVKVWNMNIPWSENPAGLFSNIDKDYTEFGSINYLGTKEYLGYASNSGQTFGNSTNQITATTDTFYYNSFDEKIYLEPEEQKAIAIIHYTNQTIGLFYGEKFALEPFDEQNPGETGQARNFKLYIPWLMWHKNPDCCHGQTFWVDPPGDEFESLNLFKVHYIYSNKNNDMNTPGIRYYHLWDNNPNSIDGYPNRVGKVFPDQKIIVIDDEELIAALSYKSNRNWTLPAPKVSLITPNTCGNNNNSQVGLLTDNTEYLYVTYRLSNTDVFTNSLHCNYYSVIQGPNTSCNPISSQNVSVRFGSEFPCLNIQTTSPTPCWLNGFQMLIECFSGECFETDSVYYLDLYPTNTYINGYPIYFNPVLLPSNVYFDGNNWRVTFINEPVEGNYILSSGSPLGSIITSGYSSYQITTECRESKQICYDFCDNETCQLGVGIESNLSGDTFYSLYPTNRLIIYSSDTSNWVLLDGETTIATLSGLTSTQTPIGTWTVVEIGITSFVTTQSTVDCYYDSCNCLSLTVTQLGPTDSGVTPDTDVTLNYMDCSGILDSTPVQSGETISQCIMGNAYSYTTTATTLDYNVENCELICTPLITTTTTTCPTTCNINTGFIANKFEIIVQKVTGNERPNSSDWKIIDFTDQISNYLVNGYLTQESLTATTFVITQELYDNADTYYLNDYIDLTPVNNTDPQLNFGDEYYFYGSIETDIQSTIYEMKYKVNLSQAEFQKSSNPTWNDSKSLYISEIALYDNEKDLMIISKLQSPVLRQGTQQFLIKFDF